MAVEKSPGIEGAAGPAKPEGAPEAAAPMESELQASDSLASSRQTPDRDASGDAERTRADEAALADLEPVDVDYEPVPPSPAPGRASTMMSRPLGYGLAAGAAIVGGLLGVVLDGAPRGGGEGVTDAAVIARLDELDSRLKRVREAIAAAEGQGSASGAAPAATNALRSDIEALEGALEQALDRVAILEAAGPGGEGGGGAALLARLDELSEESADTRRLAEEAAAAPAAQAVEVAQLKAQVAGLVDLVSQHSDALARVDDTSAAIVRRVTGSSSFTAKMSPAAVLALSDLRDAADAGEPFAVELDALQRVGGPADLIEALAAVAETGAPSAGSLTAMFPSAARAARAAERDPASGLGDQIGRAVAGVVTVRRLDAPATDAAADIVVRAEARLARNDLPAALAEMKRLKGPAAEAVAEWVEQAERRQMLDDAFAQLEDAASGG